VTQVSTSVSLSSSSNPSVAGQQVTFTAAVTPIPNGGSVAFSDNGSKLPGCASQAVDIKSGQTTCSVTYQNPGQHSITARYSGSPPFLAATASRLTQTVNRAASHTTYTGPTTADYNDSFVATATLTADGGAPIAGRTVDFKLGAGNGTESCSGPTDASGVARCPLTPNEPAGSYPIVASFAGDGFYTASSDIKTFTIIREETTTTYTGPTVIANGVPTALVGVLKEDGSTGISGRTITMSLGSGPTQQSCVTGPTDASGSASCTLVPNQPQGPGTVTAAFLGDRFYLPSSDPKPTIVFAFLKRGAFVIGDQNAVVGNAVTFWGAQWAKENSLSGGNAPAAFKGFADETSTTPPACGGNWIARPGNSSSPPDSVPAFMAVIASSSISKSGATISGDIAHIVIVKTDPGYAPDPGHPATGTVVAVLC